MDMQPSIALLEREKDLWSVLAVAIECGQEALLSGHPTSLMRALENQANLCSQLSSLPPVTAKMIHDSAATKSANFFRATTDDDSNISGGGNSTNEQVAILQQICAQRDRVRHSNRVQAELLQRARRFLHVAKHLHGEQSTITMYSQSLHPESQYISICMARPQE
jgi:hypothetical protein